MKRPRVPVNEKLCFVLGVPHEKGEAVLDGGADVDMEGLGSAIVDHATAARLARDPSAVAAIRVDPNRLTMAQLARIPGLKPQEAERVAAGRPYYSMAELQNATGLSGGVLSELFTIPPFRLPDKPAGREKVLEPVPGRYIVAGGPEFEEGAVPGFDLMRPASANFPWRVVAATQFEDVGASFDLKLALGGDVHPVVRDPQGFERHLVPGSLDLWFRRDTPEVRRRAIIAELGLIQTDSEPRVGYYRVRLAAAPADRNVTRAVMAAIEGAHQFAEVTLAEPDEVGFEDFEPDRSLSAGSVDEFEASDLFWNYDAIELSAAHEITKGSEKVTLIIVDSGTRMSHPDLEPSFRPGWPALDLNFDLGVSESEASPDELAKPHGTRVAGVAAGRGAADTQRARGVAPGCRVLPIKIPGQAGGAATPGYGKRAAAILQALTYLQPGERAVLNLSWKTSGEHIGIREALREAQAQGVAIVASAGNYLPGDQQRPDEIHYPSAHAYLEPPITALCSVAAVGFGDRLASYSFYGAQSVTVAAPGGESGETGTGIYTSSTPDTYVYAAGTSYAAPHVAGLIALMFSIAPSLTAEEAIEIIRDTADSVDHVNPMYAGMLGGGRINARAALQRIRGDGRSSPPDVLPAPTPAPPPSSWPSEAAPPPGPATEPSSAPGGGRVSINSATFEQLLTLPLVGPWRATRLIEYRGAHGPFGSVWSLALTGAFDAWTIYLLEPLVAV